MDALDVRLCQLLMRDSTVPYRELADTTGLSVAAVHGRVEQLVKDGVIRKFTTNLSMSCQGAIPVVVFGRSELPSADKASEALSKDGVTYAYLVGAGNMVYVCGYLRSVQDLERYAHHARTTAKMADPIVALETMGPPGDHTPLRATGCSSISPLDRRIVAALHGDSRRPLSEVAEELGITAKTAKRHWDRMEAEGLLEKSIQWNPDASGDIVVFHHLSIDEGLDKFGFGFALMTKYGPNVVFFRSFSNLPGFLQVIVWGRSLREAKEVMEKIERETGVRQSSSYVVYKGYWFETWRDILVPD